MENHNINPIPYTTTTTNTNTKPCPNPIRNPNLNPDIIFTMKKQWMRTRGLAMMRKHLDENASSRNSNVTTLQNLHSCCELVERCVNEVLAIETLNTLEFELCVLSDANSDTLGPVKLPGSVLSGLGNEERNAITESVKIKRNTREIQNKNDDSNGHILSSGRLFHWYRKYISSKI